MGTRALRTRYIHIYIYMDTRHDIMVRNQSRLGIECRDGDGDGEGEGVEGRKDVCIGRKKKKNAEGKDGERKKKKGFSYAVNSDEILRFSISTTPVSLW